MLNRGGGSFGGGAGSAGALPGGSGTELQYRSGATSFGAASGTTWDNTNKTLAWAQGTLTTSNPFLSHTATWNAGAVAFINDNSNVTNTASAAGSMLWRRQVGGSTMGSLRKDGLMSHAIERPGGVLTIADIGNATTVFRVEDWILAGAVCTAASRTCGEFHWWMSGTDSAMLGGALDVNHPGVRILSAGATTPAAGESCVIDSTAAGGTFAWPNNFDTIWVVQSGTSDTNTKTRFGLSPDFGTDPPTTGAYFEKEHAGDVGGSDTNWFFVCGDGTRARTDTTVAHGTTWVTGRIARVNSTTIGWAICAGDGCTLPALTNTTTNCPTATTEARPGARVETNTTAARNLSLDYIDLLITGLVR